MARFNRHFDDRYDKVVLLICFLAGLITIVVLRGGWFGNDIVGKISFLDYLATVFVVGIIVVYCIYISSSKFRSGVSIDGASDNAYYLGLLFTLIALSVSLLKMLNASSLDNPIAVNSALLPDFGLALFSTIAGILARIVLQQIRPGVEDIEEDVAKQLAKLMQALQGSIQHLVGNLDGLSKQTEMSMRTMIERSDEMATNVTNQVSSLILETTAKNESVLSGVADSVNRLGELSTRQIEKLVSTSDVVADSMVNMGNALEGYQDLSKNIESTVSKQTELSSKLVSAAASIEQSFTNLETSELFEAVHNAIDGFETVSNRLTDVNQSLSGLDNELMNSGEIIQRFKAGISEKGREIKALTQDAEGAAIDYVDALSEASTFLRGKNR